MVCYGVALTMVQTAITTMLQEKTDTSMQGRVFGLLGTMYAGFLPIGMAMFGPLADILPLQWIMIGSGIALIVIAGIAYYSREQKNRCFGGWVFMRQNKIQWPYGGFEITYFRAAVSFSTMLTQSEGRYYRRTPPCQISSFIAPMSCTS